MPVGEPYIPETITVHLGRPEESAYNGHRSLSGLHQKRCLQ